LDIHLRTTFSDTTRKIWCAHEINCKNAPSVTAVITITSTKVFIHHVAASFKEHSDVGIQHNLRLLA